MSIVRIPNRQAATSIGQIIEFPPASPVATQETGQVQERIWRLQAEVKQLQEELVRTRRALDHRIILLQNSQLRERELHAERGVR